MSMAMAHRQRIAGDKSVNHTRQRISFHQQGPCNGSLNLLVHLGISRNSTTPVAFHLRICLTFYLIHCIIKSPISLSVSDHTRLYFTKKKKNPPLLFCQTLFISCDVKENTPRQNFPLGGRLGLQCTSHHLVYMY